LKQRLAGFEVTTGYGNTVAVSAGAGHAPSAR
jgi:hypothetical protein